MYSTRTRRKSPPILEFTSREEVATRSTVDEKPEKGATESRTRSATNDVIRTILDASDDTSATKEKTSKLNKEDTAAIKTDAPSQLDSARNSRKRCREQDQEQEEQRAKRRKRHEEQRQQYEKRRKQRQREQSLNVRRKKPFREVSKHLGEEDRRLQRKRQRENDGSQERDQKRRRKESLVRERVQECQRHGKHGTRSRSVCRKLKDKTSDASESKNECDQA